MGIRANRLWHARAARWLAVVGAALAAGAWAGPARAAVSYSQQTLPFNVAFPIGVAVDSAGDVFVGDQAAESAAGPGTPNDVYELPAGGGGQKTLYQTQDNLQLMASDAAGDVFVAQPSDTLVGGTYESSVLELPAGGGTPITIPIAGAIENYGVAVDSAGDLFVADVQSGDLFKLADDGSGPETTLLTGVRTLDGVAVDSAGDVFITEQAPGSQVQELPAGESGDSNLTTILGGMQTPYGIAVDAGGNVYVADEGANQVTELSPQAGGGYLPAVLPFSGLESPTGVAVDQHGDVFAAGSMSSPPYTPDVVELAVDQAQSISWSPTASYTYAGSTLTETLNATASSGLPITYALSSGSVCSISGSTLTITGTGTCDLTADQTGGFNGTQAFSPAAEVEQTITISPAQQPYGFVGFITPPWQDTFQPGTAIPVWFVLTNAAGKPIPAGTAAALAKAGDVRAILTGPGITAQIAACGWYSIVFECTVTTPRTVKTGTGNPYAITAQENVGSGFLTAPPVGATHNPTTIYFK